MHTQIDNKGRRHSTEACSAEWPDACKLLSKFHIPVTQILAVLASTTCSAELAPGGALFLIWFQFNWSKLLGQALWDILVCYNIWLTTRYFLTENSVLRVPILYGDIEYLSESPVTILFENILAGKESIASDYEIKYPTHCGDIAYTIRQLADKRLHVSIIFIIVHSFQTRSQGNSKTNTA